MVSWFSCTSVLSRPESPPAEGVVGVLGLWPSTSLFSFVYLYSFNFLWHSFRVSGGRGGGGVTLGVVIGPTPPPSVVFSFVPSPFILCTVQVSRPTILQFSEPSSHMEKACVRDDNPGFLSLALFLSLFLDSPNHTFSPHLEKCKKKPFHSKPEKTHVLAVVPRLERSAAVRVI